MCFLLCKDINLIFNQESTQTHTLLYSIPQCWHNIMPNLILLDTNSSGPEKGCFWGWQELEIAFRSCKCQSCYQSSNLFNTSQEKPIYGFAADAHNTVIQLPSWRENHGLELAYNVCDNALRVVKSLCRLKENYLALHKQEKIPHVHYKL